MANTILVTGGARSGKSGFAEQLTQGFGGRFGYLATAQSLDSEMDSRICKHQQRRGADWTTIEEPLELGQALTDCDGLYNALLVDCLTLWLTNLLFKYEEQGIDIEKCVNNDVQRLTTVLGSMTTPVIIVSNEVGMGIVPENKLARLFRDIAGHSNQMIAACATNVYTVISGLPLKLK